VLIAPARSTATLRLATQLLVADEGKCSTDPGAPPTGISLLHSASIIEQQRSGKIIRVSSVPPGPHLLSMPGMPIMEPRKPLSPTTRDVWSKISGLSVSR
jgi:hypothetical protein